MFFNFAPMSRSSLYAAMMTDTRGVMSSRRTGRLKTKTKREHQRRVAGVTERDHRHCREGRQPGRSAPQLFATVRTCVIEFPFFWAGLQIS